MAELLILSAPDVARDLAAPVVWEYLDGASDPVLGATEGSMPEPLCRALDRRRGGREVSRTAVFTLDDRASPPGGHHLDLYREVPCGEIAEPLGLDPAHVPVHRGAIRGARRLVLLAFGDGKTEPVAAGLEDQTTASAPQSMAQLHPRAVAIDPKGPAYRPHYADDYRPAAEYKLGWQQW